MSAFRHRYLDYHELTEQLQSWAKAYPDLVRLESAGRTLEGRDIWIMTLGQQPDQVRPAVWIDGNMHASELCGTNVTLAILDDLLALHRGEQPHGLPAHVCEFLKGILVYACPRMSPDGAEHVLKSGRYVRSSPFDGRQNRGHSYWQLKDVDGDGIIMQMRVQHPQGELVELAEAPGLMVPRTLDDTGPFYKLFPEGTIANFDGQSIPSPNFLTDNQYDFNRNFPWSWAPEHEQFGAGDYPGSMPETRSIIEYTTARPHIFVWMNYHTYGGVFIRPLGHKPDNQMQQQDLAVYRQLEQWNKNITGYPTVSGYHEFLYEPDKPLRGDLTDYAYHQRGCLAQVCELWDLFRQIGMDEKKPFVSHYRHLERKDWLALWQFDREHNEGRIFRAWRRFEHPQLGWVELGGADTRVGVWNPPYDKINQVCQTHSHAFLRSAALLPKPVIESIRQTALGNGLTQVECTIRNSGYLATYGLPSAQALPISEPLRLTLKASDGLSIVAPAETKIVIGHLEGWGQGLYESCDLAYPWTRGNVSEKTLRFAIAGHGELTLELSSCRIGKITQSLVIA